MTKLVSWNVNGIRAAIRKGTLMDYLNDSDADMICLQEVRALPEQVEFELPGYKVFWNPAEKKGYSGTMLLSRIEPKSIKLGLGKKELDTEGRVIAAEYDDYYLVTVYTPNSGRGLSRLEYRTEKWDPAFLKFLKKLEKNKPVIFCGDLNVAHQEIDLTNPKSNKKNAGFTPAERERFSKLLKAGFIDTFREFTSEGGHYTWWSNFRNARERNIGWRIDYFGVSESLRPRLVAAQIEPDIMGSDHCPITLEIS
jgi:exodeoxyribonuclease III